MKYHLFLIPLILSIGIIPAYAEFTKTNSWIGTDGINHLWLDYSCRANGNGVLEVNFYPQYTHIRFVNLSQDESHQRIFSYEDYNSIIKQYYEKYIGVDSTLC